MCDKLVTNHHAKGGGQLTAKMELPEGVCTVVLADGSVIENEKTPG